MTILYDGIAELVTNDPAQGDGSALGVVSDGAVLVAGDTIEWVGRRRDAPAADGRVDCGGVSVVPGFVDSHAHLVFAGERSAEFAARMSGQPYAAGGIATTVAATRAADDSTLSAGVRRLAGELSAAGVTTFECKSGYGLDIQNEARSLRIAREYTGETTFLGAHVVPAEYRDDRAGYIDLVTGPMLDACAPLARWIDVFCDRGAFDVDESRAILTAGMAAGLQPRLHAGQLGPSEGIQLAVQLGAASVDHCTYATDADIEALASGSTVATLLPGAEFSTRAPWPDARRMIDAGVTVAIATDCNPGSSFTTSMPFCIAVAVRDMKFTPAEALWAATAGGAAALRRDDVGTLAPGKRADFLCLDAPSYIHLAYRPGVPLIRDVVHAGQRI
ncbi:MULTISPECIES: imidazolonepropionase [Mycobacteriaceae]|uniref:Imidazolonepropionase n=1 Tax=Mycolicibacterium mucogenicum DSM 44124 TaxID=1226753 RepID=A0A8E4R6S0_MYCMU|nr:MULTISPECIES: imidazolonepropionase [Mycobacteriaceae]KAB7752255.1 imidazolonepropionase [Mycolicibacterium mucogenicum DSM 44124]QPG68748.1 imidazolonepropionase [Mycolicibacterium mucogenicum DSM 44124]